MRVVRLRARGGPEKLAVEESERPRPGSGEALVRVQAAAITRGELRLVARSDGGSTRSGPPAPGGDRRSS